MKLRVLSALLLFNFAAVALTWAQQNVPAPAKAFAAAPEIAYDSVPNFLKLPTGMYLGEGIGVARNSKGHVFVYTRGGDTSHLYEFDPNGSFVREIGKGLYGFQMAHAVRVDPQDNIWVVDEGTDMVIKFTPDGRVAMTSGQKGRVQRRRTSDSAPQYSSPASAALSVRQADRRRLGCCREYFHRRRLHEFTGREI